MAEENENIRIYQSIDKNKDEISELEKRIKDIEPNNANHILYKQWIDKLTDYVNRIEKLELNIDSNREQINANLDAICWIREMILSHHKERIWFIQLKREIAELKEAVKLTHPTAIKLLSGDVRNIEKLLRDKIPKLIDLIIHRHDEIMHNDNEWCSNGIYTTDLAKIRNSIQKQLDGDSKVYDINKDPLIKKAQEKFQEIKDGSKSADSGGILGGAKKKRNIDLKADEEPSELYELYMKDKEQYYFKKTTFPFTEFNNMIHLGIGEIKIGRADLEKMILELRNNIYGFDKEEWFTNIEKQIGYDYKKDLKRILEERKHIREMRKKNE